MRLNLQPGEERMLVFMLGYIEVPDDQKWEDPNDPAKVGIINKQPAHELFARFNTSEKVLKALDELSASWDELLGRFQVSTGDGKLDRMVNIWNQYQCMVTFNLSRSASYYESGMGRGMGFRDSNQDLLGFVHMIPGRARSRILDIAATQLPDGSAWHQYQPLTKKGNADIGGGFNDDPLWLVAGVFAYLNETGDDSILREPTQFDNQEGSEQPLLEHLRRSVHFTMTHRGPHGLPLIGRADWNDCLNLNCFSDNPDESFQTTENRTEGSRAESLMIAGLYVLVGEEFARMLEHMGLDASAVRSGVEQMQKAVESFGWDGEWFLRAYDFYGNKIGSSENEEGKIFIESQGWCAMARIGADKGMCDKALDSVKKYLDTGHGIVLNNPAFTHYYPEMGEISTYPQGYKENAGIFCHNNPWVIIAEVLAGRGEDAWEHYCKISPAFIRDQRLHRVEPYVYCQMIAGKDAALPGEGKNSWLTGTAAWNWLTVSQYLLGVKTDYDGLVIEPCLPGAIKEFKLHRRFRDAEYDLTVRLGGKGGSVKIPYEPGHHTMTIEL